MANVLLTGCAGFIGSYVAKVLLSTGKKVVGVDDFNNYYDPKLKEDRIKIFLKGFDFPLYRIDIRNTEALEKIFAENKIDIICHLAARAGVRASLNEPGLYEEVNINGTLNLLEQARKNSVENFILASSSSVYGNIEAIPFNENCHADKPISPYAATKRAAELFGYTYAHLYKLPVTCLRFFTVYGPWGRPDMAYFNFTKKIYNNEPIDVYNSGEMERDFTYIDDIAAGIISLINKNFTYEIINLGNNQPVKLIEFINILEHEIGRTAIKNFCAKPDSDVIKTYADITKAKKLLDFVPTTDIHAGLKNFVNWYREYFNKL